MSLFEIFILSVALALDALLVSFSYGLVVSNKRIFNSLLISLSFGLFQFVMPIIGWWLSSLFYSRFDLYSKWIVFIVFIILGLKFLKSAIENEKIVITICMSLLCLISLSIATSIDALAAGITFKFENINFLFPSICIGIITFLLSLGGFWIACLMKNLPSRIVSGLGAMMLIYLAVKAIL